MAGPNTSIVCVQPLLSNANFVGTERWNQLWDTFLLSLSLIHSLTLSHSLTHSLSLSLSFSLSLPLSLSLSFSHTHTHTHTHTHSLHPSPSTLHKYTHSCHTWLLYIITSTTTILYNSVWFDSSFPKPHTKATNVFRRCHSTRPSTISLSAYVWYSWVHWTSRTGVSEHAGSLRCGRPTPCRHDEMTEPTNHHGAFFVQFTTKRRQFSDVRMSEQV